MILASSIPILGSLLSPIYFQFFLDKVRGANIFCPHSYHRSWSCFPRFITLASCRNLCFLQKTHDMPIDFTLHTLNVVWHHPSLYSLQQHLTSYHTFHMTWCLMKYHDINSEALNKHELFQCYIYLHQVFLRKNFMVYPCFRPLVLVATGQCNISFLNEVLVLTHEGDSN